MLAQVCGMKAGEFVHVIADAHIYDRHVPMIEELISREPLPAPTFWLNPEITDFMILHRMTSDWIAMRRIRRLKYSDCCLSRERSVRSMRAIVCADKTGESDTRTGFL